MTVNLSNISCMRVWEYESMREIVVNRMSGTIIIIIGKGKNGSIQMINKLLKLHKRKNICVFLNENWLFHLKWGRRKVPFLPPHLVMTTYTSLQIHNRIQKNKWAAYTCCWLLGVILYWSQLIKLNSVLVKWC